MVQVVVFWVVMLCNVVGYQCFRSPCWLHFTLKAEAAQTSETVVSYVILLQHYTASQPR